MTTVPSTSVYLVEGEDPVLVQDRVSALVREHIDPESLALAVEEYDAATTTPDEVTDTCRTLPLFSDKRAVVVRSVSRWSSEDTEGLISYIAAPEPATVLVLVAGGGGGARLSAKLSAAVKKTGQVVSTSVSAKEAPLWLAQRLAASPVRFDSSAEALVTERLAGDPGHSGSVIALIVSAFGPGAKVSAADIEPYLGATAGSVLPWDLTDAIEAGETHKALALLQRIVADQHPLVAVAILHRWATNLLKVSAPSVRNEQEAAAAMGIAAGRSSFPARKALNAACALGLGGVRETVSLVAGADLDLKGRSSVPAETVSLILIARISQKFRLAKGHR